MSKFAKLGFVAAVSKLTGGLVKLGIGGIFHSGEVGGYVDTSRIQGYTFNPADGKWYSTPPQPDYGWYEWSDPAPPALQRDLTELKKGGDIANEIERRSPTEPVTIKDILDGLPKLPGVLRELLFPPDYTGPYNPSILDLPGPIKIDDESPRVF